MNSLVGRASVRAPLVQQRRAGQRMAPVVSAVQTAVRAPVQTTTKKGMTREEVLALHSRLEARAKALISLEEMQAANRPTLRITVRQKIGLGEVWKIVGNCPELGNMVPEVGPTMQWTNGDVWVLETRIREGTHTFKAVMRRGDGAYVWEAGEDRTITVSNDMGKEDKINLDLSIKFPY